MTAKLKTKVCLLTLILLAYSMDVFAQDNSCKAFDFNLAPSYQAGANTFAHASNDFNDDGYLDIAVINGEVRTVSVLYGDGAGGFAAPQVFPTTINPYSVTSGDFNSDGKADLIAASYYENRFAILINNGNGGFLAPTIYTPPTQFPNQGEFYDLKAADFNGDGKLDVVAIQNQSDKKLKFFMGDGQGNIALGATVNLLRDEAQMEVGNLNNDNLPDIVLSTARNGDPRYIGFVFGRQDGNFSFVFGPSVLEAAVGFSITDLNNDSHNDIAIAFYDSTTPTNHFIQPWLNNGSGSFYAGTKIDLSYPFPPSDIVAGDFNNDGKQDLAALLGTVYENGVIVMVTNGVGDGTYRDPRYYAVPSSKSILSADVNLDNKKDLIAVPGLFASKNSVSVLINDNFNGFKAPQAILWGPTNIEAGDFNNDNYKDFVSAWTTDFNKASGVDIALNDTKSGLSAEHRVNSPGGLKALKIGDFNGDGNLDAVTAHTNNGKQLAVYFGNGTGVVETPVTTAVSAAFENIIVGDFNSDGKDDVFGSDANGRGFSMLSNGNGTFTTAPNFPVTLQGTLLRLQKGDFNEDGKLDLIISNGSIVKLWLGDGTGQFTQSENSIPPLSDVVTGDFDDDGNLDLAGFADSGIKGVLGNGNGEFGETFLRTGTTGNDLVSADFNLDGFDDLAFYPYDAPGTLAITASGGEDHSWTSPVLFSIGTVGVNLIAADFNNDGKPDIGYVGSSARGIIYNTGGSKPCLSINDVTVTEGDSEGVTADFTVKLSAASEADVYVNYSLAGQSGTIGTDLQNTSGRLKIPAGQTTGNIAVTIIGDLLDEFDETFLVHLASPSVAVLQKADAIGTITDNDAEPTLTISDVSALEGFFGQSINFQANLSAPSAKPISFRYTTADGSAGSGDYSPANRIQNIPAGTTSFTISITVLGENMYERDENFFINLSEPVNVNIADNQAVGTITNDDQVPVVFLNFGSVTEGDTGITSGTVNLQLSNPTYLPIYINVLTSDGTAVGGKDYKAMDKVVNIPAEQMSGTTDIQVFGDTINEPSEHFFLNIYNTVNANVTTPQTQFAIFDDEFISNDFDRDGKTDAAVFRPGDKNWYILYSSNNSLGAVNYGLSSDKPVSGDYNGDGRTDIAVWRAENGTWYTPIANRTQQWGTNGDIPVHGDYDNDGKIDVALFRPTTQTWYIQLSSNGTYKFVQWGLPTDTPVPADYDGDGKTDIAVYRPEAGSWYILRSSDGGLTALQFGISSDKPTPADYDGDGKADITVFRDGVWHQLRSSDGNTIAFQWGTTGDKPVPGNYDGDDKTDFAVYRDGVWYIWQSSTNSYIAKQFGLPDDIPIPFVSNN